MDIENINIEINIENKYNNNNLYLLMRNYDLLCSLDC